MSLSTLNHTSLYHYILFSHFLAQFKPYCSSIKNHCPSFLLLPCPLALRFFFFIMWNINLILLFLLLSSVQVQKTEVYQAFHLILLRSWTELFSGKDMGVYKIKVKRLGIKDVFLNPSHIAINVP